MNEQTQISLSEQERIALIYRIRVWYPQMRHIYDHVERAFEINPLTPDPECLALLGRFRTGKTTIIDSFCHQHPLVYHAETTHIPILKAVVPAKATMGNLLTALLAGLRDPFAARDSIGRKYHRLQQLLHDCGVQMLILDEANHFVDRDSARILHDVSNTLKNLVKTCNLACILVGLPYTEEVLRVNEQFGSLFGDPVTLHPFQWNENQPETIQEFRTFLHHVESQLPLPTRSFLGSRELAWRCFVASYGKVGYIMRLLRRAAELAVRRQSPTLTLPILHEAFQLTLAGTRRGIPSPFLTKLPTSLGPVEKEYWPVRRSNK